MNNLTIFGREIIDENCIQQMENCLTEGDVGVLTADAHYGYGHPIGGVAAYENKISLSGVGFDIACGNKAVKTNIKKYEVNIPKLMDAIFTEIGFGLGRPNPDKIDHEVFDKIAHADFKPQRNLLQTARNQLGTVGGGNHFIDVFEDLEDGYLWVGVHFGSRGFGHKTATGFIAMSEGGNFEDHGKEKPMDSPPIVFDVDSGLGQDYIAAMELAGEYAYAGRDAVVSKVLKLMGAKSRFEVHNHHNFAWREQHQGKDYWVVRKGCTPAFPGQTGFVGSTMSDISVVIEGVDSELSRKGLYSTVHGAGRVISRRKAAGKTKWMANPNGIGKKLVVTQPGIVDFKAVKKQMKEAKIELRGAGADEAPECYKKLEEVLGYHDGTIKILHRLKPLGVAMAGLDVFDPYKD